MFKFIFVKKSYKIGENIKILLKFQFESKE